MVLLRKLMWNGTGRCSNKEAKNDVRVLRKKVPNYLLEIQGKRRLTTYIPGKDEA